MGRNVAQKLIAAHLARSGEARLEDQLGGLWLWKILVPSGLRAVVVPSGCRATFQPHWWIAMWWWKKQYRAQPSTLVVPPSARWVTWWTSQAEAGWSQPPAQRQAGSGEAGAELAGAQEGG